MTQLPKPKSIKAKEAQPDKVVIANSWLANPLLPKPKNIKAKAKKLQPKVIRANSWLAASFPVENFQAYTSPFGYRRSATGSSNWEFHGGLDIAAPQGSYIRNWWAGTVVKVGDAYGGQSLRDACGTHIVIKSGEWEHTYCHMEGYVETVDSRRYLIDHAGGIQIWEGQQIPTGVRIGRVGMTGRTTGPHLHWGLKYANNYVDPVMVLREMYSQQRVAKRGSSIQPQQSQVIIQESKFIRDSGY
ncbi:M23 family metallopeptidase [Komarekiella sp. 'clone 1']|uniref:M23 family metallopeptidase n=2 Tax=Komarekiella TaxID=2022127 RepID=A0AA40VS21_9NOST|nr:M23 family metallopeptidase [Komarekiella delphini-convector]MBD6617744.1 M23 family metallopeptidase [Komarekiella delphini-convector SJRDD-AB1]